jgi:hypothetical protein
MPDVDLELPPELLDALKDSAEQNRRSMNDEIRWRLEKSFSVTQRPSNEEILRRADRMRERLKSLGFSMTDEEITRYKNQGRL